MNMSTDQTAIQQSIYKSARNTGIGFGVVSGLISLWALSGQPTAVWIGSSIAVAGIVGFGIYKWRYGANSDATNCEKCGAKFALSSSDKSEKISGSEAKEETELLDDGTTKITRWLEEKYLVTESFSCAKCQDITVKEYNRTRRKNVAEEIIPKSPSSKAMDQRLERMADSKPTNQAKTDKPKAGKGRQS